jgi:hypothetical protein
VSQAMTCVEKSVERSDTFQWNRNLAMPKLFSLQSVVLAAVEPIFGRRGALLPCVEGE